jgi:hypothetical protein
MKRKLDSSVEYSEGEESKIVVRQVQSVKCVKLVLNNKIYPVEYRTVKYQLDRSNKAAPSYIN